jgi:N-acetylglucosaminyldiphosphoundecaprenol N-acetyl-beta-D-mannosaminyltransferase
VDSTNYRSVRILGVSVDSISADAVIDHMIQALRKSKSAEHIVTYNPEYAMSARRDPRFLEAISNAYLTTADGVGIVLAARLHRDSPRLERITGVDLLGMMAQASRETGVGIYLLGAGPEIAPRAATAIQKRYPNAIISGWWWEGTPRQSDDVATIARIRDSGARMLVVAYGAPAQIHWIARNHEALNQIGIRLVVGVGGALDYWAGEARRPPKLIRKLGLEWLFRLVREPWRWRRQLVLPVFAVLATIEAAMTWLPWHRGIK